MNSSRIKVKKFNSIFNLIPSSTVSLKSNEFQQRFYNNLVLPYINASTEGLKILSILIFLKWEVNPKIFISPDKGSGELTTNNFDIGYFTEPVKTQLDLYLEEQSEEAICIYFFNLTRYAKETDSNGILMFMTLCLKDHFVFNSKSLQYDILRSNEEFFNVLAYCKRLINNREDINQYEYSVDAIENFRLIQKSGWAVLGEWQFTDIDSTSIFLYALAYPWEGEDRLPDIVLNWLDISNTTTLDKMPSWESSKVIVAFLNWFTRTFLRIIDMIFRFTFFYLFKNLVEKRTYLFELFNNRINQEILVLNGSQSYMSSIENYLALINVEESYWFNHVTLYQKYFAMLFEEENLLFTLYNKLFLEDGSSLKTSDLEAYYHLTFHCFFDWFKLCYEEGKSWDLKESLLDTDLDWSFLMYKDLDINGDDLFFYILNYKWSPEDKFPNEVAEFIEKLNSFVYGEITKPQIDEAKKYENTFYFCKHFDNFINLLYLWVHEYFKKKLINMSSLFHYLYYKRYINKISKS